MSAIKILNNSLNCVIILYSVLVKQLLDYEPSDFTVHPRSRTAKDEFMFFSIFFFFRKKIPIVVVRDVCPSVRPSVRLSSVEIISFRGISISNRLIDLKIGLNVCKGVVHVRKA